MVLVGLSTAILTNFLCGFVALCEKLIWLRLHRGRSFVVEKRGLHHKDSSKECEKVNNYEK